MGENNNFMQNIAILILFLLVINLYFESYDFGSGIEISGEILLFSMGVSLLGVYFYFEKPWK